MISLVGLSRLPMIPSPLGIQRQRIRSYPIVRAAEAATFAGPLAAALKPTLFVGQSLMLLRIVLSWFPEIKETEPPWLFAYIPTEPLLQPTRRVIPPAFGVDISPVVWLELFSFVGEVLVGPQGILNLIQRS